jgi:hypothetical protein
MATISTKKGDIILIFTHDSHPSFFGLRHDSRPVGCMKLLFFYLDTCSEIYNSIWINQFKHCLHIIWWTRTIQYKLSLNIQLRLKTWQMHLAYTSYWLQIMHNCIYTTITTKQLPPSWHLFLFPIFAPCNL